MSASSSVATSSEVKLAPIETYTVFKNSRLERRPNNEFRLISGSEEEGGKLYELFRFRNHLLAEYFFNKVSRTFPALNLLKIDTNFTPREDEKECKSEESKLSDLRECKSDDMPSEELGELIRKTSYAFMGVMKNDNAPSSPSNHVMGTFVLPISCNNGIQFVPAKS